ncbi:MAG: branched-chain amino acid ABC transporter permease [Spirochaetes bacterium RBG_16_49_21]|nr:MAG: branched-chain amino acid ABC transporter permease [Spirochaetes bacterium RBG_16_49_21]
MSSKKYIPVLGLIASVIAVQVIASALEREFYLTQLTMSAYYTLVILGLTVLMGYAGQISLGHAAFFAMGGYTTAVLTTYNLAASAGNPLAKLAADIGLSTVSSNAYGVRIEHLSPWAALVVAAALTAGVAFLIGIPILKLKGHYLAMATLGFGIIVYRIVLGSRIFGEADGISDLPPFRIAGGLTVSGDPALRVQNYYIAAFLILAGIIILNNLVDSRVGRALRSIRGSEEAANTMGVNTARYKLFIFVISAVFACIAGVFLTHFNGGIGPSEADVMKSVSYVAIVAVGGMANLWGALVMGIVLNYLSLRGYFGSYDELVFGGILIVIMLFFPDGLLRSENFQLKGIIEKMKRIKHNYTAISRKVAQSLRYIDKKDK